MPSIGRYSNASTVLSWAPDCLPNDVTVEPITLPTSDRSATTGLLFTPAQHRGPVVAITHPRVDVTDHYLIPPLLRAGYAVWAQRTRTVNNDLNAIHEQLLVDLAKAHRHLAARGMEPLFLLGNSGGASLYCLYLQQASRSPGDRFVTAPSGLPVDLTLEMPIPAGLVLLAPHPGQGDLLLHCIDPSVADEGDPASTVAALDLFDPANGFREPPDSSSYDAGFVERYRAAQRERVARIDARAREILDERRRLRREARERHDGELRRRALAPTYLVVHRTDADPRCVDLALDPSDRDYGSIFGRRPDVTNFGPVGFGRLATPDAWLSTWSGLSSRAAIRLTAPEIKVPSLIVSYTADNSVFPADVRAIHDALGSADKQLITVRGDHYGFAPGTEQRSGGGEAGDHIVDWLRRRSAPA